MSLDGVLYHMTVEEARLKPGLIASHKGPARNISELKNAAKLAYATHPTVAMHKNLDGSNCMLLPHCMASLLPSLRRCLLVKFSFNCTLA